MYYVVTLSLAGSTTILVHERPRGHISGIEGALAGHIVEGEALNLTVTVSTFSFELVRVENIVS